VIIATSGDQKALLKGEFPSLSFIELPGYNVKYGKNRALTLLKIITSIPKILIRINRENNWLKQFLVREKVDAVISDNRYGLHSPEVFSILMTHQLHIKTSSGKMADRLLQRINYRSINRFSLCWVPDGNKENALAGDLSHPGKMPAIPVRYIGLLSRFEPCGNEGRAEIGLLILLSGPEPQRTILENKVLEQLAAYPGNAILVRGLPGGGTIGAAGSVGAADGELRGRGGTGRLPDRIKIYDHLPSAELNRIICGAGLVISRPGYSSIMDLLKLNKRCVFIPTPGQTEQEYLGDHLAVRKLALSMPQRGFSLPAAVAAAKDFPFATLVSSAAPSTEVRPEQANTESLLEKEIAWLVQTVMDRRKGA
jgi:UDP-N-acetylglucosamine transferase subunit ALG13